MSSLISRVWDVEDKLNRNFHWSSVCLLYFEFYPWTIHVEWMYWILVMYEFMLVMSSMEVNFIRISMRPSLSLGWWPCLPCMISPFSNMNLKSYAYDGMLVVWSSFMPKSRISLTILVIIQFLCPEVVVLVRKDFTHHQRIWLKTMFNPFVIPLEIQRVNTPNSSPLSFEFEFGFVVLTPRQTKQNLHCHQTNCHSHFLWTDPYY